MLDEALGDMEFRFAGIEALLENKRRKGLWPSFDDDLSEPPENEEFPVRLKKFQLATRLAGDFGGSSKPIWGAVLPGTVGVRMISSAGAAIERRIVDRMVPLIER
jgi:hypothetical protein